MTLLRRFSVFPIVAILALVVFFVVGLVLLVRVDARQGIAQAGNAQPVVV